MSLAVPSALILAALALPIIVFYILKIRLRRIPVSTNLFWKQIYDEKPPRSIWQRFRHLLSLLAQLLLLALMVFALADPYFSWQALQARQIVAVIDTSASMQATDVSPSRFEASINSARNLVEGMRFRDKMAIVLTGRRPEVVLGMSDHVPTLKRALRDISVSDNPTDLESAIDLGKQLIGDHPNGSVVVFTDACATSLEADESIEPTDAGEPKANTTGNESDISLGNNPSQKTKVEYRVFATAASNVGITQFQVRRSLIDMLGYEVLVSVKNASDQPINCRLDIELDNSPVDVLPLQLKPNEVWTRALEKTSLEGGQLVAKLASFEKGDTTGDDLDAAADPASEDEKTEPSDSSKLNSLAVDDTAWAILPAQEVQNVLVITKGNLFLRKVFEANPLVNVNVASEFPETWPNDTLIVLHNHVPEKLPTGNVFVVDPIDSCDAWELGELLENPIVTQVDSNSDLMTHVRLDNVVMPSARKLLFKTEPHILAGALSTDPVYAQLNRDSGKGLVLSVNLEQSDLAFRTAFPIMVTNALSWFAGSSGNLMESASTGEIVAYEPDTQLINMMTDNSRLLLASPSGKQTVISDVLGDSTQSDASAEPDLDFEPRDSLSLGPFNESGVWKLRMTQETESVSQNEQTDVAQFAVNISNQRETDLIPPEAMLAIDSQNVSLAGWFAKPVWYYLIGLVSLLFVTEWLLYQRRFIS